MKPYAILMLEDLKVRLFDDRDEWQTAVETLTRNEKPHVPLKYHQGTARYTLPEVSVY